jgi:hypothetical protein
MARVMSQKEIDGRQRANNDGGSITLSEAAQAEALADAPIALVDRLLFKGIADPVKKFLIGLGEEIKINSGDILASPDPAIPRRLILSEAGIYCDIIAKRDPSRVLQQNILLNQVGLNAWFDGEPTVIVQASTDANALAIPQVSRFYDPGSNENPLSHEDVQQLGTNATEGFSILLAQLNKTARGMGLKPQILENLQMGMFKALQKLRGAVTLPLNIWEPFWPGAIPREHSKLISARTVMAFSAEGAIVDFDGFIEFMIENGATPWFAELVAQFGNCPVPNESLEVHKLPTLAKVQGNSGGNGVVTLFEAQGLNNKLDSNTKPSAVFIPIQKGGEVVIASFENIKDPRSRLFMLKMALGSLAEKTAAMSWHIANGKVDEGKEEAEKLENQSLLARWLF